MGNGKSKSTKSVDRTPAFTIDWKNDSYINQLITSGRLAPKAAENNENREAECPICFMLKRASTTSVCPFCGDKTLAVTFSSSQRSKLSSPSADSVTLPPPKPTYTTPEQDRKLRSMSSDGITVTAVSKQTREELEKQISTQRMMYHDPDEDNRVYASVRRPRAVTTSAVRTRNGNRSPRQRHSDFISRGTAQEEALLSSLRTLIGTSQMGQINSLEELEELMLLEAIRQSQSESSAPSVAGSSSAGHTPVAPSNPSPSHQSPSTRRRKASRRDRSRERHSVEEESRLSNSVSSSGSGRLDSGSEGNNSNSKLSELEIAAALGGIEASGKQPLSPDHSSGTIEEEEVYDEELELALQLSLMNVKAPVTPPSSVAASGAPSTVPREAAEVDEYSNSKLSADQTVDNATGISEAVVKNGHENGHSSSSSTSSQTSEKVKSDAIRAAAEAFNNSWLNEFEAELLNGKFTKASVVTDSDGSGSAKGASVSSDLNHKL